MSTNTGDHHRAQGPCAYCGIESDDLTEDHVIPRAWSGNAEAAAAPKLKVPACRPCNGQSAAPEGSLVMVSAGARITPAHLLDSSLVEPDYCGLERDALAFEVSTLNGTNKMLASIEVGRFEHKFVIGHVEVAMEQGHTESVETAMLRQYLTNLFEAVRVGLIDRPDVGEVPKTPPLHS